MTLLQQLVKSLMTRDLRVPKSEQPPFRDPRELVRIFSDRGSRKHRYFDDHRD